MRTQLLLFVVLTLICFPSIAQKDSLVFTNNNFIVGEFKALDKGSVTFETDYSDSDFKIDYEQIKLMHTSNFYLLTLENGLRINGNFYSKNDSILTILTSNKDSLNIHKNDLVFVKEVDEGFFDRVYINLDLGASLAKANNQLQLTLNSRAGYVANKWSTDIYFNTLLSQQDSIADIRRTDAGIGYRYYLPANYFISGDVTFLSNTEQALDSRINTKAGIGKYVIRKHNSYWAFGLGVAGNIENYSQEADSTALDRQSVEGYLGTELNLYDVGDLDLFLSALLYPSFTEEGRYRSDIRFDAYYELPKDFYIRTGFTVNYDNQPAISGNETDYVITGGFGWSW